MYGAEEETPAPQESSNTTERTSFEAAGVTVVVEGQWQVHISTSSVRPHTQVA